ncbi:MAG TPA: nuclear transport factor 2 family protein [Rhodoblastus sp.]|nr:nuclear transport factor 2 family protein [Rhodoblastus sp.]
MGDCSPTAETASLDRATVERCIHRLIALRADGDVDGLVAFAAPDIVFKTGIGRSHPFHAEYRGAEACAKLVRDVNVCYENLGSRLNRLLIDGDQVALHRTTRIRNRGTGRAVDVDMWNFVRFRDGLIVEFAEYPDTAAFARLDEADA